MSNQNQNKNNDDEIKLPISLSVSNNEENTTEQQHKINEILAKSFSINTVLNITPKILQIQTKYIYNLKRSSNVPDHMKIAQYSDDKALKILPNSYNILSTSNLYTSIPVYDQGNLGSCVSNALAFVYSLIEYKQKNKLHIKPSRLFIYYNGRAMEKTINVDNGLEIYDGFSTIKTNGVCDENMWPYIISKFAQKPTLMCYKKAMATKIINFIPIAQTLNAIQYSIYSGYPVVIGIDVYESFESQTADTTGIIPLPNTITEQLFGGHCVVLIGYDNTKSVFTFRNSWGINWGDKGNGYLPYSYVMNKNLSFDFYAINSITNPNVI